MNQKIDEFCDLLQEQVDNHSIYVWGGNGETFPTLSESWIRRREKSTGRAEEALKTFNERVAKGYDKIRAFDCSGLGYYCLKKMGLQKSDLKANTFYTYCRKIDKKELCKGCFVFHLNEKGVATHVGYVVDDKLNVIEALGRADGVVKRAFNKGKWVAFGKPKYFTFSAEPTEEEKDEEELEEKDFSAIEQPTDIDTEEKTIEDAIAAFISKGTSLTIEEVKQALWN